MSHTGECVLTPQCGPHCGLDRGYLGHCEQCHRYAPEGLTVDLATGVISGAPTGGPAVPVPLGRYGMHGEVPCWAESHG